MSDLFDAFAAFCFGGLLIAAFFLVPALIAVHAGWLPAPEWKPLMQVAAFVAALGTAAVLAGGVLRELGQ